MASSERTVPVADRRKITQRIPQRPVLDVGQVQSHHGLEVGDLAAAAHLPHAGDAGHQTLSPQPAPLQKLLALLLGWRQERDHACDQRWHILLGDAPYFLQIHEQVVVHDDIT